MYKSERERDVKDTNITSTIGSLKKEVPSRLAHRKSKEVLINSQLIIRQLTQVGVVLIHLVYQIEDLELEARHKVKILRYWGGNCS